jgi:hypothetical protein
MFANPYCTVTVAVSVSCATMGIFRIEASPVVLGLPSLPNQLPGFLPILEQLSQSLGG